MTKPRKLTQPEVEGWFSEVKDGNSTPPKPKHLAQLQLHMSVRHPILWARFCRDYRKVGKIISKELGMNPEDARWLL